MPRVSTSRDDAPAYLIRYENRRAAALVEPGPDPDEPGFVARARARATERAPGRARPGRLAPPGRTEAFARETELASGAAVPESFRSRHGGQQRRPADPPRPDAGLHLRRRAHPARSLAGAPQGPGPGKGLKEGMTVRVAARADTARASETAVASQEGVLQA